MRRLRFGLLVAACVLSASACSSSRHQASTPAGPVTMVKGAVVDAFVIDSTVTAYAVNSSGALGACVPATPATNPASCATATTDATGSYTIDLGSYSGAVLLQAVGGSYTDTVTGQTVPLPSGLALSVLLPSVSPGTTALTAQITPLTTMATLLALEQASQGVALTTALQAAISGVESYFGGLSDIVGTALLDLTKSNCGTAAEDQASFDASLILAGIAEVASQYGVTSAALEQAVLEDVASDGAFDGSNAGVAIQVPLASGSGSVALTTIYGSSLAQSIGAAISTFETSAADACNATGSSGLQPRLAMSQAQQLDNDAYSYSISGTYTLTGNYVNAPQLELDVTNLCSGDTVNSVQVYAGLPAGTGQQSFFGGAGSYVVPLSGVAVTNIPNTNPDWSNSCGSASGTLTLAPPKNVATAPQSCSTSDLPANGITFTSTDNGNHNTASYPTTIGITCQLNTFSVGGNVTGLAAGTALTLSLTDATNSDDDSSASVMAGGSLTFTFSNSVTYNDQVTVAVTSLTQPSGGGTQTCVITPQFTFTVTSATTLAVTCSTSGGSGALDAPEGLAFYNNLLYVANSNANRVLVLSEQLGGTGGTTVTGLTQIASITQDLDDPVRLAVDSAGYLYVANIANNTVTVYNTNNDNQELTASGAGPLISGGGISHPLGVAVDSAGNVYVANNAANSISVFAPNSMTAGDPTAGFTYTATLTADKLGNAFLAPGVIVDESALGFDFLLVGLGPTNFPDSILLYEAPLSAMSSPLYHLSNSGCSSMPSGPTGIALYPDLVDQGANAALYVTSLYNDSVVEYTPAPFLGGTAGSCPTPVTNKNGINGPQGVAVDSDGNVFVSNAASTGTNANTITVYAGNWQSNNPAPVYVYSPP